MVTWIKIRSQDIPPSGPIVMAKARDYALSLNIEDFSASEGWLHCFRERHEIMFCVLPGESKDVSREVWHNDALQEYLKAYPPRDIFNVDKTAMFYTLLPSKTMTYKGDSCADGKRSNKCITVLVAANMIGTEKLALSCSGMLHSDK